MTFLTSVFPLASMVRRMIHITLSYNSYVANISISFDIHKQKKKERNDQ